ncbi:Allergen [Penicillium longicatenatum]|uniref:Allergen n=1 Tax=Penicillium longicatenatum TaxID=1561947 RepID=UPI0025497492|nr:Allergen [Penicillium longicatenatum]KAJ5651575.1 Allergen [Penicillium longicatenatum]
MQLFRLTGALICSAICCQSHQQRPCSERAPYLPRQGLLNSPRIYLIANLARSTPPSDRKAHPRNVGAPYGSNIIEVPGDKANQYKYVVRFNGPAEGEGWSVVIWNKLGPDGIQGGWYGKACRRLTLAAGQSRFIAFDENSQGGWATAPGTAIPLDSKGGYASTWGEFDFGSSVNDGWSGFDVSAIQAQNAGLEIQGMQICDVLTHICSAITRDASHVQNAYTWDLADVRGIGGNLPPGPVRLEVTLDYAK